MKEGLFLMEHILTSGSHHPVSRVGVCLTQMTLPASIATTNVGQEEGRMRGVGSRHYLNALLNSRAI
jgi:hypothetical protein